MSVGFWQIVIVALVVVLLFGRGKISDLMGDVAQGIKSFKKGMTEDTADASDESGKHDDKVIEHEHVETVTPPKTASKRKAS